MIRPHYHYDMKNLKTQSYKLAVTSRFETWWFSARSWQLYKAVFGAVAMALTFIISLCDNCQRNYNVFNFN